MTTLAEVDGFEPPREGVKVPCLAAWLHLFRKGQTTLAGLARYRIPSFPLGKLLGTYMTVCCLDLHEMLLASFLIHPSL